uniref:uncharacterized protein LOC117610982 n=1 Tax=Osmia lignaria TaxID=473952 RepID=UPI001478AA6C|nr:uncharacterized protein LOC117610982 [Osmia lignaria]
MEEIAKRRKFLLLLSRISRVVVLPQQVSLTGKQASRDTESENLTANQEDEKKLQEIPRKTLKHYFNRFRYYHYCVAEKIDTILGIVCFGIIKIYLFFMGSQQQSLQSVEEMNIISIHDDPFD